jgi:DNA-directed RNA polymerase specialized sigma24 family protein
MLVTPLPSDIDPLLAPFMHAADEEAARDALGEALAHHASPLIRRIVGRQLGSLAGASGAEQDVDDVHATVLLRLTAQCWTLRRNESATAIVSLSSYVATTTYNACHEWLRTRAPRRARLQNRVRYVLTRDQTLALWEVADREWWCGVRQAPSQAHAHAQLDAPAGARAYDEVVRCIQGQMASVSRLAAAGDSHRIVATLVQGTLAALGAPCRFSDLVSALAEALGETDVSISLARVRPGDESSGPRDLAEQVEDTSASPAEALEQRDYLTQLWSEIVLLPARQRAALLLNLRDENGGGMLALFPLTGIASTADIARALDVSDAGLSELWPALPRDDQWIAEYLGLTRRQVINLRKCARERLARRMRARETMASPGEPVTSRAI